jgi:hypothetical protein
MVAFAIALQQTGMVRVTSTANSVSVVSSRVCDAVTWPTCAVNFEAMISQHHSFGMRQESTQQISNEIFILGDNLLLLKLRQCLKQTLLQNLEAGVVVQQQFRLEYESALMIYSARNRVGLSKLESASNLISEQRSRTGCRRRGFLLGRAVGRIPNFGQNLGAVAASNSIASEPLNRVYSTVGIVALNDRDRREGSAKVNDYAEVWHIRDAAGRLNWDSGLLVVRRL